MRRVRAKCLLRCVILASCVAALVGVSYLGMEAGWAISNLVFVAVLWLVGIEGGLLPLAIEYVVVRRAARSGKPVSSIWFVDLDQQRSQAMESFHDDTSDNPTIR